MGKHIHRLRSDERGIVSIIVTIILILLMSLVVLAMSQNANREQRQALDRQLSDQAFYNAESGINDWASYLTVNADDVNLPAQKDFCATEPGATELSSFPGTVPNPQLDGVDGVNSYSCILYDKIPPTIVFDGVSFSNTKTVPIQAFHGSALNRVPLRTLTIKWTPVAEAGATESVNGCSLTIDANWPQNLPDDCDTGVIRIDLFRANGALNRNALLRDNYVAFLAPGNNSGGTVAYRTDYPNNQGVVGKANCSAGTCQMTITGLPNDTRNFFLSIKSIYKTSNVTISGTTNGGSAVRFNNAQLEIDSTGRANDVLRRVKVRLPFGGATEYISSNDGSNALRTTTQAVCKLITVSGPPGSETVDNECERL